MGNGFVCMFQHGFVSLLEEVGGVGLGFELCYFGFELNELGLGLFLSLFVDYDDSVRGSR